METICAAQTLLYKNHLKLSKIKIFTVWLFFWIVKLEISYIMRVKK